MRKSICEHRGLSSADHSGGVVLSSVRMRVFALVQWVASTLANYRKATRRANENRLPGTGWSSDRGTTLVELLVVMAIISILAVVSVPYAEIAAQRSRETQLRDTLRETRSAIDAFHRDWATGVIRPGAQGVSVDGYPVTLSVLVEGVPETADTTGPRRYLRRLPINPFAARDSLAQDGWQFWGYRDGPEARSWNRVDVYDLAPLTDKEGLDGTSIAEW